MRNEEMKECLGAGMNNDTLRPYTLPDTLYPYTLYLIPYTLYHSPFRGPGGSRTASQVLPIPTWAWVRFH